AELRAAAKSFGERFPDSVHTTEAAYHAAAAAIRGTRERGSTSQDDVSTPLACEGMLAALEPIASDASPNNPWSTAASGLRALCLGELRPDPPEPVIEAIDRYIELSESDESSLTEFDGRLRLELSITRLAASDLPDFALTDLDGVEASLARYRGKLLLLDFWAPG
ncbi:MAG: hypothetical protein JSV80_05205, partial [Acidobacteriota bacterium]